MGRHLCRRPHRGRVERRVAGHRVPPLARLLHVVGVSHGKGKNNTLEPPCHRHATHGFPVGEVLRVGRGQHGPVRSRGRCDEAVRLLECDSARGIRPTPVARPASTVIGSMKRPLRRCSAALRPGESVRLEDDGVVGLYVQTMAPRCAPQIAVAGDLVRISRRCTPGLRSTFRPRVRGQGAQEGGVRGSRRERSTYGVAGSLEGDPEGKRVGDPHGGGPALGRNAADKNLVPLGDARS
jgi:hypothetical protein